MVLFLLLLLLLLLHWTDSWLAISKLYPLFLAQQQQQLLYTLTRLWALTCLLESHSKLARWLANWLTVSSSARLAVVSLVVLLPSAESYSRRRGRVVATMPPLAQPSFAPPPPPHPV